MKIGQKSLIEIDGKQYMSPKTAAGLWEISTQKVVAGCKAGKIPGACKDSKNAWIIPVNAKKPIEDDTLRLFLVSLLAIKNKPSTVSGEKEKELIAVLDYLGETEYIEPYDKGNGISLSNVVLSDKGMNIATAGKKMGFSWVNASITLIQVAGSIASIWALH